LVRLTVQLHAANKEVVDDEWLHTVARLVVAPLTCTIFLEHRIPGDVDVLGGGVVEASSLAPTFIADEHHWCASVLEL
jgi:hypothetical protein